MAYFELVLAGKETKDKYKILTLRISYMELHDRTA
jgi:hypothetical protein